MNHIYRRIWNTAKQCWVVCSELARTTGRSASGRRTTVLMGCLISLSFAAGSAELDPDGEQL
ncbi:MAG: ESPR domain-containing protein, partial [Stenotrophomonas sp.]|nr:ESPR domain-containing protein [Stenotrophomonas sp.]